MKVKCISNNGYNEKYITVDKIYRVIETVIIPFSKSRYDDPSGPFYKIMCDFGEERHVDSSNFRELTVSEKRQIKIQEILNDR